jgi:hypothetical protein
MTERRSSLARSMAPELNDGEGAGPLARSMASELNGSEGDGPSGRGAALGSGKAMGPAHGERGGVRWLDTDEVAKNRGKHDGDGLPGANTALVRTRCRGRPFF